MNTRHGPRDGGFDEALISGYIDEELSQVDGQRVRIHLEDCPGCNEIAVELRRLKEITMGTEFAPPEDTQWDEAPRTTLASIAGKGGLLLLAVWVIGMAAYLIGQAVVESGSVGLEHLLTFGLVFGLGLVILSALLDRLSTRRTDRYRKVRK